MDLVKHSMGLIDFNYSITNALGIPNNLEMFNVIITDNPVGLESIPQPIIILNNDFHQWIRSSNVYYVPWADEDKWIQIMKDLYKKHHKIFPHVDGNVYNNGPSLKKLNDSIEQLSNKISLKEGEANNSPSLKKLNDSIEQLSNKISWNDGEANNSPSLKKLNDSIEQLSNKMSLKDGESNTNIIKEILPIMDQRLSVINHGHQQQMDAYNSILNGINNIVDRLESMAQSNAQLINGQPHHDEDSHLIFVNDDNNNFATMENLIIMEPLSMVDEVKAGKTNHWHRNFQSNFEYQSWVTPCPYVNLILKTINTNNFQGESLEVDHKSYENITATFIKLSLTKTTPWDWETVNNIQKILGQSIQLKPNNQLLIAIKF